MSEDLQNVRIKERHIGSFGDHQMSGFEYENESGPMGWLITIWPNRGGTARTYWVEKGEVFSCKVTMGYNYTNRNLIQTFGVGANIQADEKEAILKAVSEWERDPEERERSR